MSDGGAGRKPKRHLRQRLNRPTHLLQPLYDKNHLDASYDRYVLFLLLSAGLKKTGHTTKGQHIFLTVQPHISAREIEDIVKNAFVSGARRVSMEYVPVATAVAMKKSTALVVSLGERHTFISPVIHGQLYSKGILRSAICGHLITHFLQHVLLGDIIALPTVRFLKETRAHIAHAFKEEEQEQRGQIMNVRTALGTKESVPLHYLVTCGEPYFRPKSIIKHYFGHDAIPELRRRGEATTNAASLLEAGASTPANLVSMSHAPVPTPSAPASTLSPTNSAQDLPSRSGRTVSNTRGSSRGELVDLVSSNSFHSDPSLNLSEELGRRPSSSSIPPPAASSSSSTASTPLPSFCELDWVNGLHQLIMASIALCPPEYHIELLKNIVIEGEGAKYSGLTDRLRMELEKALKRAEASITVCPSHSAWRGCAILSSTLHSRTVSRQEFQESSRSRAAALFRLQHQHTPKVATGSHNSMFGSSIGSNDEGGVGTLTDSAGHGATDGSDSAPGSGRVVTSSSSGHRVVNRFAPSSSNVMDLASAPTRRVSAPDMEVEDLRESTGSMTDLSAAALPPGSTAANSLTLSTPSSSSANLTASSSFSDSRAVRRVAVRRGAPSHNPTRSTGDSRFSDLMDLRSSDTPPMPDDLESDPRLGSASNSSIASTSSPTLPSSTLPDTSLPELVDLAPSASAPSGLSRRSSRRRSVNKPSQKKSDSSTATPSTASTPSTQPSNGSSSPRSSNSSTNVPAPGSRKIHRGSVKSKRSSAKSDRSSVVEDAAEEVVTPKERSPRPSLSKHNKNEEKEKESKDAKESAKDKVSEREKEPKEKDRKAAERASLRADSDSEASTSTANSIKHASSHARNGSDSEGVLEIDEIEDASGTIISESAMSSDVMQLYNRYKRTGREGTGDEEDSLSLSGSLAYSNSSSISSASVSSASNKRRSRVIEPRLRRLSLGLEEIDRSNIERQSSSPSIPDASPTAPRRISGRSTSGSGRKALTGSKKWRSNLSEVEDLATSSSNSSLNTASSPPASTNMRVTSTSSGSPSVPLTNASSSSSPQDAMPTLDISPESLSPKSNNVSLDGGSVELPLSGRIMGQATFAVPSQFSQPTLSTPSTSASSTPNTSKKSKKEKRKKRESTSAQDVRTSSTSSASLPLDGFSQTLAPHLDSPDHIKSRPLLPPRPHLNRTHLVIQFVQPMAILLNSYWKWLGDYFTPFVRHQLRDREFLEQYVIPRYQKFIYLKNNVDSDTAAHIHPDIFIELAWQAHMCRPTHYRAYSTKHYKGRIIHHDMLAIRLAHELDKDDLEIMQKHWKKAFGESFTKTMPSLKLLAQPMQTITTPAPSSSSSNLAPPTATPGSSTATSSSVQTSSPISSEVAVASLTGSGNSPRSLPPTDYITAPAYQPALGQQASTSGNGSAGNVVTGTSSPRLGSTPSVFSSSSGSLPTGSVPTLTTPTAPSPKPGRGKHKAKADPAPTVTQVPTIKFAWKTKDSGASSAKSSTKAQSLPDLDFDLAGAILEDLDSNEACTSSLRKVSQGAFTRKNWSSDNTQFMLIKSYELFFYALLKYGNKYSQPYFKPPPYLAVVARAHMCFPHLYVADCRKYHGHLVGMGPLVLPEGVTAAQAFEKARKLLAAAGLRSATLMKNKPEEMLRMIAEEEFGGPLENVVRPCPQLPPEVLARIFKKLPTRYPEPGYVCHAWSNSMMLSDVWRSHTMHDFPSAMGDLPSDPRSFRPFYNEKLREAISGAVIFDFGAAKVRCGVANGGGLAHAATDSSTRNSDDTSSDSDIDAEHGLHSTDYAVSGHAPMDDNFRLAPRYVYQAVVRRAITSKRK